MPAESFVFLNGTKDAPACIRIICGRDSMTRRLTWCWWLFFPADATQWGPVRVISILMPVIVNHLSFHSISKTLSFSLSSDSVFHLLSTSMLSTSPSQSIRGWNGPVKIQPSARRCWSQSNPVCLTRCVASTSYILVKDSGKVRYISTDWFHCSRHYQHRWWSIREPCWPIVSLERMRMEQDTRNTMALRRYLYYSCIDVGKRRIAVDCREELQWWEPVQAGWFLFANYCCVSMIVRCLSISWSKQR